MRDFRDAKAMAQTLREALKGRSVSITHSESLELVARLLGFHDWNVLSAQIQSEQHPPASASHVIATPLPTPGEVATVPLRDIVLFPRMTVPIFVARDASKRAVERAMAGDRRILALTQRRSGDDNPVSDGLYSVGLTANILHFRPFGDGRIRLIVEGLERMTVLRLSHGQFLAAEVAPIKDSRGQEEEAFSFMHRVLEEFAALHNIDLSMQLQHNRNPSEVADSIAPGLSGGIEQKQDLLETGDVVKRLEKILGLMKTNRARLNSGSP